MPAPIEDNVCDSGSTAGLKCFAVFAGHGVDMAARPAQELLPKQQDLHLQQSTTKAETFQAGEMLMQPELAKEANMSLLGTSSWTVTCLVRLLDLRDCRGVACESADVTKTRTTILPGLRRHRREDPWFGQRHRREN